ncbi:MAG TPA: MJ0042-type zinc finger domain-containing protein [Xanthobacteraceae bacterium]|nr:MJ0042-type zinc finger domain-containing protein [Xanthobacteraceae bacterium]
MQLSCPACHTAFHVEPSALGTEGRTVRCVRCRNTWFARTEDLIESPALAEILAEGEADAVVPHAPSTPLIQSVVEWNDMVMVEAGPSLVPDSADIPVIKSGPAPAGIASPRSRIAKSAVRDARLGLVALLLGIIVVIGLTAREPLVRAVPSLASFYGAVGLPVNLRGIEFSNLRTSNETQDGTPVLVIEGEIANPTRYTREIPRLRLAVQGAGGRELYSWTALLPRETLMGHESFTFRSRLASPPEGSERVSVRFLHRTDLTDAQ